MLAQPEPEVRRTTSPWQLRLLGAWRLSDADMAVDVASNGQRLLTLLALRGTSERSYLASVLWPDCSDLRAQGNLRATLSRLNRRNLRDVLLVANGTLALAPAVDVDVHHLIKTASEAIAHNLRPPCATALRLLSEQDLLVGWFDEWIVSDRERIRQLRLRALEELCDHLLSIGDVVAALEAALEAVSAEPLSESAHRAVIRAHLARGDRAEALLHFTHLRRLLHEELGVTPSGRTLELLRHEGCL